MCFYSSIQKIIGYVTVLKHLPYDFLLEFSVLGLTLRPLTHSKLMFVGLQFQCIWLSSFLRHLLLRSYTWSGVCTWHLWLESGSYVSEFAFYCFDKRPWPKAICRGKVLLVSHSPLQSIIERSQGKNSSRNKRGMLLASLFSVACLNGFFYVPGCCKESESFCFVLPG